MKTVFIITRFSVPKRLRGYHSGDAIRPLADADVIALEDQFHQQGEERRVPKESIAFILPETVQDSSGIPELLTTLEFACSIVAVTGHPSFLCLGILSDGKFSHARHIPRMAPDSTDMTFVKGLTAAGFLQWLRRCLRALASLKDRMHITANRFVRFARSDSLSDGIMDLCISLESLLDHQTEVSFRFSISLARATGAKGGQAERKAALLGDLYDARSKLAHGDPSAARALRKLEPHREELRTLAKEILTAYVLCVSEKSREEWKRHIQTSLYS